MNKTTGISIDQKSLDEIQRKIRNLPIKVQNNAARAAIRAGAGVLRDRARSKAPACLVKGIKTKARKGKRGSYTKASVIVQGAAGGYSRWDMRELDSLAKEKGVTEVSPCEVPIWYEMGTYGQRRYRTTEPYNPETLRKPNYASGKSDSPFWKFPNMWVERKPFLRPAAYEASKDGSIQRAIAGKLKQYIDKYKG